MDKKLLALFRKLLALDEQALPDSISPENFGKLLEKSAGKLFIKPEDFKRLQQTVSQKDGELKKVLEQLAEKDKKKDEEKSEAEKKIDGLVLTIDELKTTISTLNTAQQTERLQKLYPDILPDLLIGKSDDQAKEIVERQREINKKLYGDSQHFAPPDFSSEADIDEAINKVKTDPSTSGENTALSVLQLNRKKDSLPNAD